MSVTLKDISKKAGVSVSTVSRIINNDTSKPASKETAEKVWQIVKELGYVPNQNARKLIRGEASADKPTLTKTIGCIFTSTKNTYNDPFYSQIALGIQNELAERGYLMAYSYSSRAMSFSALYNNITANPVDGVIIMGRFGKETLDFFKSNFKNLVYAGVNAVNEGFDEVICDGYKGGLEALEYLRKLGHDKIGFIGETSENSSGFVKNEHRFEAYMDMLRRNNIDYDKELVIDTPLEMSTAYEKMKKYLSDTDRSKLASAYFAANDFTAIGVIRAIKEFGLKVPEDISIISLDDIEMASFVSPPLTTIGVPKMELGQTAVKILIDKIENNREYPLRVDIPFKLVERDSVIKINKK